MSFILGLDVGTTSGAGATKRDGRVQPCALGDRTATLPAVVVLHGDGTALIGEEAERLAGLELTRVARDLRYDPVLQTTPITVGGEVRTPHELLRTLYAAMVQRVSAAHGAQPTHVVLTHPALPEGMRCETVDRIADELFPGALVVPEPVAATVKLACDGVLAADCLVAVYDFGGGTFDTTLVQRDGDRFSVLGDPAGLGDFGGIDIDDLVLDHVNRSLDGAIARLDMSDPASIAALTRLRAECRDAKERLSYDTEVTIDASLPNLPALVQLTRAEFEAKVGPRLETTVDAMLDMIGRAGFTPSDVDAVALVGGSSRIPMVVDMLARRTGMHVLVDPYPELTVALGAAQMVDDEVSSNSVFPLADMTLPSLSALGAALSGGDTGPVAPVAPSPAEDPTDTLAPTGIMGLSGQAGPGGPGGGMGMGHNAGTTLTEPTGAATGASVFDQPYTGNFDGLRGPSAPGGPATSSGPVTGASAGGAFGGGLGVGVGNGPPKRKPAMSDHEARLAESMEEDPPRFGLPEGFDPRKLATIGGCIVAVLVVAVALLALTGGGGDDTETDSPASSLVDDETAGTATDTESDAATATSLSPSSSSSTSSTSSTSTTEEDEADEDDPVVPPGDDDPGTTTPTTQRTTTTQRPTPTTRPTTTTRPPTTLPPTTTSPPTTTTTTTTAATGPDEVGTSLGRSLREQAPEA